MANINLPTKFDSKLKQNQHLEGIVKVTLSEFGEILKENKLYFFEEYTDHGLSHIENVIFSSYNIISESTSDVILSSNDISYYILVVILHDIGMHLNLEGFQLLLEGAYDDIIIEDFDKKTWLKLWEDFLNEAKRFSGKQLSAIFGDENFIIRIPPIYKPLEINESDKHLIGEFIRQNHPRIAHEIAIKGFPFRAGFLEFAKGIEKADRNMIGLIARSHGKPVRECMDYIEKIFGRNDRRNPLGIHVNFLMIVLRLSDYLQIDASRTPKIISLRKSFLSPLSQSEHYAHIAVNSIDDQYQDDPERIYVNASPRDSLVYLKLKKLIKDIQNEFDLSWAILGELYGKFEVRPTIKYRRILSNLENKEFITQQVYLADNFTFKANDEIINLLIRPLYGSDPTFGVRELLQNAVDACNERGQIENKKGNLGYKSSIKIEIVKTDNEAYFIITDNGIGMDHDVLKNYFLRAGASFRKSKEWQDLFQDEHGDSIIRRSGRFGIGILAAFLIGNKITVETKRIDSAVGYKFEADLNSVQIDVLKDDSLEIGTSIKIPISDDILKNFDPKDDKRRENMKWYEWFTLSNPSIIYSYLGSPVTPYDRQDPDEKDRLPLDWNSIDFAGFNKILWTYSKNYSKSSFTCNGIVIPRSNPFVLAGLGIMTVEPNLNIFDNNGLLPLDLNRNAIVDNLPFINSLREDIYKEFIAYVLTFEIKTVIENDKIGLNPQKIRYSGNREYEDYNSTYYGYNLYDYKKHRHVGMHNNILLSKEGFILEYNFFIRKLGKLDVVFIQPKSSQIGTKIKLDIKNRFLKLSGRDIFSIEEYKVAIEARQYNYDKNEFDPFNSRIYLSSEQYHYLFKSAKRRVSIWLNNKCKVQFDDSKWTCLHLDNPTGSIISKTFLEKYLEKINFIREYEIVCPYEGDKLLDELFQKYLGDDVIIPFSLNDRRSKFPRAFQELDRYMQKFLLQNADGESEEGEPHIDPFLDDNHLTSI